MTSWQTLRRRRDKDIEFLAWLRTASKKEVAAMLKTTQPEWRLVALYRALKRELLK